MFEEFKGKVVIVTGGATGMGRTAALKFASLGAKVAVVTGHNMAGAEDTAAQIKAAGGEAAAFQCDVSAEAQVEAMVADVTARYGRIDCAFNNAGTGPDGVRIAFSPLEEVTEAVWDKIININLKGVFLCLKHELRQMHRQGGPAAIVNTSSIGGLRMAPGFGAYGPSKAGVIALTQLAAQENAAAGIRVNVVCPGPTAGTGLLDNLSSSGDRVDQASVVPMGKLGTTEDVANAVVWLCSNAAGHITGQALSVDGGMHM